MLELTRQRVDRLEEGRRLVCRRRTKPEVIELRDRSGLR
jgi:hypothetical protein